MDTDLVVTNFINCKITKKNIKINKIASFQDDFYPSYCLFESTTASSFVAAYWECENENGNYQSKTFFTVIFFVLKVCFVCNFIEKYV